MKKAIDGLILRDAPTGENDRLVTILTAEEGRFTLTAKGARSMKSKVGSACRLFTYGNYEYYEKNDRYWLSGGSVNESFFGLCEDLEVFALASYVSQIACEITGEGVPAEEILRMTLNTLYCLEKQKKPLPQIKAAYELYAVRASGMAPELSACADCHGEDAGDYWLDVMNGLIVCDECIKKRSGGLPIPELDEYSQRSILLPIDRAVLGAMRYIMTAPIQRIFAFSITDPESADRLYRAAEGYLLNHLERGFETLDFYKRVSTKSRDQV